MRQRTIGPRSSALGVPAIGLLPYKAAHRDRRSNRFTARAIRLGLSETPLHRPGRARSHSRLALLDGRRFHENNFPNVPVQILKSVSVHKAVVLWGIIG